ncbi:MAG: phage tail sheath family protein [Bacteroidetes bacterium]|nr:MAG: phage tail sheath family protein [Bacteroidota bacterium]
MTYNTPGVYVEEISTLPPSVAGVATAIPAFIGYTETGPANQAVRIDTMLEFKTIFGGPQTSSFTVNTALVNGVETISSIARSTAGTQYLLYYCMEMFFKNGGGSCYIISVGNYSTTPAKSHFETGLGVLEKEDEPTLILLPDALSLGASDYYDLCQQVLAQCGTLKDRFGIFDVRAGDSTATEFRNGIGTNDLKYGAAYTPHLYTSLSYAYQESNVSVVSRVGSFQTDANGLNVSYRGPESNSPKLKILLTGDFEISIDASTHTLTISGINANENGKTVQQILDLWAAYTGDRMGFELSAAGNGSTSVTTSITGTGQDLVFSDQTSNLDSIASSQTALYNQIKRALSQQRITLPPSTSVAGVYAKTDRERGVWKAPANVSLSGVIAPAEKITHADQDRLNVDPTAGKSINAIRSFAGKGTLIWGARTLAGNDNEWRYINVRRLFNMIEESVQKATAFAVFEANTATTWLKVKGMIDSYLFGLWQQGALAGPSPEAAYFVNVGLGKTMTPQDILEGRMIVEIGIAAVRPAEFIILRFSHKLQEA